jgi:quinol monooxygenase YgiN
MSVAVIYNFQAADGKAADLLALLLQGRDFAATVEGFEAFEVYQGVDDPRRFVMVERWTSAEAHRAHFEKNVKVSGVLDMAEAVMVEPFKVGDDAYYLLR